MSDGEEIITSESDVTGGHNSFGNSNIDLTSNEVGSLLPQVCVSTYDIRRSDLLEDSNDFIYSDEEVTNLVSPNPKRSQEHAEAHVELDPEAAAEAFRENLMMGSIVMDGAHGDGNDDADSEPDDDALDTSIVFRNSFDQHTMADTPINIPQLNLKYNSFDDVASAYQEAFDLEDSFEAEVFNTDVEMIIQNGFGDNDDSNDSFTYDNHYGSSYGMSANNSSNNSYNSSLERNDYYSNMSSNEHISSDYDTESGATWVSQSFYEQKTKELENLKFEFLGAEKLSSEMAKSLPDGGHQLIMRIEHLRSELEAKKNFIASLKVQKQESLGNELPSGEYFDFEADEQEDMPFESTPSNMNTHNYKTYSKEKVESRLPKPKSFKSTQGKSTLFDTPEINNRRSRESRVPPTKSKKLVQQIDRRMSIEMPFGSNTSWEQPEEHIIEPRKRGSRQTDNTEMKTAPKTIQKRLQQDKEYSSLANQLQRTTKTTNTKLPTVRSSKTKPNENVEFKSPPMRTSKPPQKEKTGTQSRKSLNEISKNKGKSSKAEWDELSAGIDQMKPSMPGKQGMNAFAKQKALTMDRLKNIHDSLKSCPDENTLAPDPKGLQLKLMKHQKHALAWLNWRETQFPSGGILADDMGLGKTLTMISMVLDSKGRGKNSSGSRNSGVSGGTLIVSPASVLRQWEGEVHSKVTENTLTVCVHHGSNRETKPSVLSMYDIVITTYNIVAREHKTTGALYKVEWGRIILDEAHIVRNYQAQTSQAVSALKGHHRWALTGTPVQNKELDVFAILKFLRCKPFDDLATWTMWIDTKTAEGMQRLNLIIKSLMLRRTKAQLQECGELKCLPQKRIEVVDVELNKDEMDVYQKVLIYSRSLFAQFLYQRAQREGDTARNSEMPTLKQLKDPKGAYFQWHKKFTEMNKEKGKDVKSHDILVLLLRLRQVCCHPGLIGTMLEGDDKAQTASNGKRAPTQDLFKELQKLTINEGSKNRLITKASDNALNRNNPIFDLKRPSTKMIKVLDILKKQILKSSDKAIVVSQWTSVLNILKVHIEKLGVATLSLNGNVAVKDRQNIVSEFNKPTSNRKILLLSLTAGGVGLNLIGANHLLLVDSHWNPQLEAQAQDRIYRVGQSKNVVIYKFICKETIEERIKTLQEHKLAIAHGVLTGSAGEGSTLSLRNLKDLFAM